MVNTGEVSTNRVGVTATGTGDSSDSRAIRIRRSPASTGSDQASQSLSGANASPVTSPSAPLASSVSSPDAVSSTSSRPSWQASATRDPSGAQTRSNTRPIAPAP